SGRASVQVGLDVRLAEREQRRAPVDHRADRTAVRLAEGRQPEERTEGVAHALPSGRILAGGFRAEQAPPMRGPDLGSNLGIKQLLDTSKDPILSQCWFWLAQYGPTAVVPPNWPTWTM